MMAVKMRVLVTHPGMQHSHQLALALEQTGFLARFWSGVPVMDSRAQNKEIWARISKTLRDVAIPQARRRHFPLFPMLRRIFSSRYFKKYSYAINHRLDHAFDYWVSRKVKYLKPDIVVCYENSAFYTFREAKKMGALCILDAAAVHYLSISDWSGTNEQFADNWINTRKQAEIELADAIITCSELAAETYVNAGVERQKIFSLPLGTEISSHFDEVKEAQSPVSFLFVGNIRKIKGADWLLDVFDSFEKEGTPASLTLIGGIEDQDTKKRLAKMTNTRHFPFIQQPALFNEMAKHDCLILPSRFDSFGMVVPEAMSLGLPVVLSERVGSKCIIEKHRNAGWIVPMGVAPLKAQLLEIIEHPEKLKSASIAARLAAQEYTWSTYHQRVVLLLTGLYDLAQKHNKLELTR